MKNKPKNLVLMSLCICINVVGALIAVAFKLPIFLDTIGTFIVAFTLGPIAGMIVGAMSYLITTITFDPYAIYFIGSQIVVGLMAGVLYKKDFFKKKPMIPVATLMVSLSSAFVAAIAAAYVFGGITSSGNTIIIKFLEGLGVNLVTSVFVTQALTEFVDKFIIVIIALNAIKVLNKSGALIKR